MVDFSKYVACVNDIKLPPCHKLCTFENTRIYFSKILPWILSEKKGARIIFYKGIKVLIDINCENLRILIRLFTLIKSNNIKMEVFFVRINKAALDLLKTKQNGHSCVVKNNDLIVFYRLRLDFLSFVIYIFSCVFFLILV